MKPTLVNRKGSIVFHNTHVSHLLSRTFTYQLLYIGYMQRISGQTNITSIKMSVIFRKRLESKKAFGNAFMESIVIEFLELEWISCLSETKNILEVMEPISIFKK